MNFEPGNTYGFFLLLLLPLLAYLIVHFIRWKKSRRLVFAQEQFHQKIFKNSKSITRMFPVMFLLATLLLLLSIMDFISGSEAVKSTQKMNNVIYLLDVSNSMNAEDIKPSRLAQAKNIMVQGMGKAAGDRVGMVVFAGEANSIMPLTTDFSAARTYADAVETSIMPVQGTDFLKAIKACVDKFKNVPKGARTIVLISDGEDNEGHEEAAADLAKSEGIRIISVAVGTEEGAPVPEYAFGQLMGYKTDTNGETVISKRQTNALKNLAEQTGGAFVDGNNMESAIAQITTELAKKTGGSSVMVQSQNAVHYYQYFLLPALLLFFLIYLINPKRDLNL